MLLKNVFISGTNSTNARPLQVFLVQSYIWEQAKTLL
jgi:hypothetical protein